MSITGTIKILNTGTGFGRIAPDGGRKDFVHIAAMQGTGRHSIAQDQPLNYGQETGFDGRLRAIDLQDA